MTSLENHASGIIFPFMVRERENVQGLGNVVGREGKIIKILNERPSNCKT